jgi:hypothetical protein
LDSTDGKLPVRLLLWISRVDSCLKFEIDPSRLPDKWLLLALKKISELKDSSYPGQDNGISPERLLLLTSKQFRLLLHSKDLGRVAINALLDKFRTAMLGRMWPISAGIMPFRWLLDRKRPCKVSNGADQGNIGPANALKERSTILIFFSSPSSAGIDPFSKLPCRCSSSRITQFLIAGGIRPVNQLYDRSSKP